MNGLLPPVARASDGNGSISYASFASPPADGSIAVSPAIGASPGDGAVAEPAVVSVAVAPDVSTACPSFVKRLWRAWRRGGGFLRDYTRCLGGTVPMLFLAGTLLLEGAPAERIIKPATTWRQARPL